MSEPARILTPPKPYQKTGVRMIEGRDPAARHFVPGRALLADVMGLGKTYQALAVIARNPDYWPALVVCPASVKYGWAYEAATHLGWRADVLEGRTSRREGFNRRPRLTIVNYDVLDAHKEYLKRLRPRCVVADEVQNIANETTIRTQAFIEIAAGAESLLGLSGTPVMNRPRELWTFLSLCRPDVWSSRYSFLHTYCGARRAPWGWDFNGATNVPQLHRKLRKYAMVRRTWDDVGDDVERLGQISEVVPITLRDEDMAEYNAMSGDWIGWLKAHKGKAHAKRAAKAEAITRMTALKKAAARFKLRGGLCHWIDAVLDDGEKLAAFFIHRGAVNAIANRYGDRCVQIHGGITGRRRQAAIDRFGTDPDCGLTVGNIMSMGVGLNGMQGVCSTALVGELPWRPSDVDQAIARLDRIGQLRKVRAFYAVAVGTIEEDLCELLTDKRNVAASVIDGKEGSGDFDLYDALLKRIEGKL